MKQQYFFMVTRKGALGLGDFPFHEWHKREKENIMASVGVKVEYGEQLEEAKYRGIFKTVSDKEHAEIIQLYCEENLGMVEIANRLQRSSRTPHEHIRRHNRAVRRSGFCPVCARVGSQFSKDNALRGKCG